MYCHIVDVFNNNKIMLDVYLYDLSMYTKLHREMWFPGVDLTFNLSIYVTI